MMMTDIVHGAKGTVMPMFEYIHRVSEDILERMPDNVKDFVKRNQIIRCNDCKFFAINRHGDREWSVCTRHFGYISVTHTDFCSFAEKRGKDDPTYHSHHPHENIYAKLP